MTAAPCFSNTPGKGGRLVTGTPPSHTAHYQPFVKRDSSNNAEGGARKVAPPASESGWCAGGVSGVTGAAADKREAVEVIQVQAIILTVGG